MPSKNENLHGNAPDKCPTALLLIDVINDLEFEGGEQLLVHALPMAAKLAELRRRAKAAGLPVIYVNDNFGRWRSDFRALIEHCERHHVRGRPIVELLRPNDDDYFVLKPKHSAFFSTTLETLLRYLRVETLIITGIATNICVLFTAHDAYMRDYSLIVPQDCVAANKAEESHFALEQMRQIVKADTRSSIELEFEGQPCQFDKT